MARATIAPRGRPSIARAVAAAVLAPAAASAVALLFAHDGTTTAVSMYLLGVVVAAIVGGLPGGIGAALLSVLALNYLFTPPRYTFRVGRSEDVVALAVFVVVAAIVQSLVARVVSERELATRREQQTRLLHDVATRLLSGERLELVLADVAHALVGAIGLARCDIVARVDDGSPIVVAAPEAAPGEHGAEVTFPIKAGSAELGRLTVSPPPGDRPPSPEDRRWIEACARQVAVALEREQLDAEVAAARIESQSSDLRAALFSSVTHDLRTPLASIKASVTSLLDGSLRDDPAGREDLLRTVLEETDRLNRLVGNLLDLARVRAGALEPTKRPTHLDEVVESVLHRMRDLLAEHRVRTILRPDVPAIPVDPVQIDQLLTNVLENAARFSASGSDIVVSVAMVGDDVQVRVADQGPGIPAEERGRAFEAFYRRDAGPGRGGTGLGLAIAQAIVLAHGGRIRLDDTPGGGTVVLFELPAASGAEVP